MSRTPPLGVAVALLVASVLVLSACSGTKRAFGLEKTSPDEFQVVSRAPLSMPPDFSLRPPEPGKERPQELAASEQARQTVFGIDANDDGVNGDSPGRIVTGAPAAAPQRPVSSQTLGEVAFLSMARAYEAEPNIRLVVDRESALLVDEDRSFLDRLLNFRDPADPGTVVDAPAEARRLRENQALGLPPTAGPTPKIERKERGLLEGIF
ncbi:MAG: DUF3035 domain-containing protein [Alphaproteobacteria bacterium]